MSGIGIKRWDERDDRMGWEVWGYKDGMRSIGIGGWDERYRDKRMG